MRRAECPAWRSGQRDGCEVHPLAQTMFRTPSFGTAHQVAGCWGAVASRQNVVCLEQKSEEFPSVRPECHNARTLLTLTLLRGDASSKRWGASPIVEIE